VLLNKGDGSFGAKRNYRTGWIYSVAIGDLNGDRRPDLVVGSVWGFPSVLLNRGNGRVPSDAPVPRRGQAQARLYGW
jgi:FG-GAP-like repeat